MKNPTEKGAIGSKEEAKNLPQQITEVENLGGKYEREKFLKNEACAFIIASGELEKFLAFQQTPITRNRAQSVINFLTSYTNPEGEWLNI